MPYIPVIILQGETDEESYVIRITRDVGYNENFPTHRFQVKFNDIYILTFEAISEYWQVTPHDKINNTWIGIPEIEILLEKTQDNFCKYDRKSYLGRKLSLDFSLVEYDIDYTGVHDKNRYPKWC